jgi:transcriptional regulator with XRE-family HTH domain
VGNSPHQTVSMVASLQIRLGRFLRRRRGDLSLSTFARKLGVSSSSLHRMEMGEQNVTLKTLELLLVRMKAEITEVFDDGKK